MVNVYISYNQYPRLEYGDGQVHNFTPTFRLDHEDIEGNYHVSGRLEEGSDTDSLKTFLLCCEKTHPREPVVIGMGSSNINNIFEVGKARRKQLEKMVADHNALLGLAA